MKGQAGKYIILFPPSRYFRLRCRAHQLSNNFAHCRWRLQSARICIIFRFSDLGIDHPGLDRGSPFRGTVLVSVLPFCFIPLLQRDNHDDSIFECHNRTDLFLSNLFGARTRLLCT